MGKIVSAICLITQNIQNIQYLFLFHFETQNTQFCNRYSFGKCSHEWQSLLKQFSYLTQDVIYIMIRILIVAIFALQAFGQVPPPVWPEVFQQTFVESYTTSHMRVSGKLYYDTKRQAERVDRINGQHEVLCGSVLPNVPTPCTHLVNNKKRYIVYPERRMCCMCCDEAHGCGVSKRDWLKDAKYEGEQSLSGESFYKWALKIDSFTDHYYATKTEERIPRRLVDSTSNRTLDFIMNTYSTEPISESIFTLPNYCNSTCPATTICGKLQSMNLSEQ